MDIQAVGCPHNGATNYATFIAAMPTGSDIYDGLYNNSSDGLYNGNIVRMHTALSAQDESVSSPTTANNSIWAVHGNVYHYDQLNRIKENIIYEAPTLHTTKSYSGVTASPKYGSQYSYDANGNLLSLVRNGNLADGNGGYGMDNFTYDIDDAGTDPTNRLLGISDAFAQNTLYAEDIDNQSAGNYEYDLIGNLIKDVAEQINTIEWSVYGKVRKVIRESNSVKPDLEFVYDPSGQRTMKIEKTKNTNGTLKGKVDWIYTLYSRDAQGNILSVYTVKRDAGDGMELTQDEVVLYGSSRLGVWNRERSLVTSTCYPEPQYSITNTPGNEITTCEVDNQDTPMDPQLLSGAGNPDPDDVQINQNASTIEVTAYQVGTTGFTSNENFNTSQVSVGSASIWVVAPEWITGRKQYELTDHLGNVLTTVSDVKKGIGSGSTVDYYEVNIKTTTDYYPFGMPMPGRSHTAQKCSTVVTSTTTPVINENFSVTQDPLPIHTTYNASTAGYFVFSAQTTGKITGGELSWTRNGGSTLTRGVARNFSVVSGASYTVSFKIKGSGAFTAFYRICDPGSPSTVYYPITSVTTSTSYTTVTFNFNASSSGTYMLLFHVFGSAAFTCYIDDLSISQTQNVSTTVCGFGDQYRYQFNGKEKTDEAYGVGNMYDYGMRIYDPRICRFLSIDPYASKYPFYSPYQFAGNNPIWAKDLDGKEQDPAMQDPLKNPTLSLSNASANYIRTLSVQKKVVCELLYLQIEDEVRVLNKADKIIVINTIEKSIDWSKVDLGPIFERELKSAGINWKEVSKRTIDLAEGQVVDFIIGKIEKTVLEKLSQKMAVQVIAKAVFYTVGEFVSAMLSPTTTGDGDTPSAINQASDDINTQILVDQTVSALNSLINPPLENFKKNNEMKSDATTVKVTLLKR